MGVITSRQADRAQPDAQAVIAQAVIAQAVIAEARAPARRRRLKVAAALAAAALLAAAGVLISRAVTSSHAAARADQRPAGPAAGNGIVTGHLAACSGIAPTARPGPVTPGTVVVLRGKITWKPDGPGAWHVVFPNGPAVAREHISDNYDQTFRFALPPGHYVLAGRYDPSAGSGYATFREITVTAGATIQAELPDMCR